MVAGAAAGLARYLGVDVMIVPSISPPSGGHLSHEKAKTHRI
jgi:hypothetical protein